MKDIRSEVYKSLEEIVKRTGANAKELEEAIEWFEIHYFEEGRRNENGRI